MRARTLVLAGAIAIASVVLASGGAFAWLKLAPRRVPPGQPSLYTFEEGSTGELRKAFDAGDGTVRVVAMLSPT